jgi:putative membrane protein
MTRTFALAAALAAGLALPALAADTAATDTAGPAYQNLFTQDQARQHLMHLGYTNISALTKDESGKWLGRATKDGKDFIVGVDIKGPVHTKSALTN